MTAPAFEDIDYRRDPQTGIVRVTLNRPERKNAMTFATFMELLRAADLVEEDDQALAMVITGAPDPGNSDPVKEAFSSGGYFNPHGEALGGGDGAVEDDRYRIDATDIAQKRLALRMLEMGKPVIAAMNGYGIGAGFTMPLACADLIYMAENAWVQMPFVRLGIVPEFASTYLLPHLLGMQKAKEILYFGKRLSAEESLSLGLVNGVVPRGELLAHVEKKTLALVPPRGAGMALRMTKRAMFRSMIVAVEDALDRENRALNMALESRDFKEGIRARLEKREAVYKGC